MRDEATRELKQMPAVAPSRLMPDDTLVYVELREPGRMLNEVAELLTRAELYELVRERLIGMLRQAFLTDISKLLNRSVLTQLGQIEGVGLGLHNVELVLSRAAQSGFQPRFAETLTHNLSPLDVVSLPQLLRWLLPELLRGKLSLARELWRRKGVLAPMQQALAEATARCSA